MIDNIPQANPAVAPFAAPVVSAENTQPAGSSVPQEPFASALQSRLQQLLAGSKTAARAGGTGTPAPTSADTQTQRLFATLAAHMRGQPPSETAAGVGIPEAATRDLFTTLADTKPTTPAAQDNDADSATMVTATAETSPTLLAIPLPISAAQSQPPATGIELPKGAQGAQALATPALVNPPPRDAAQPGNLTAVADAATGVATGAATFAAPAEKNGAVDAALAETGKDTTFAALLKNHDTSGSSHTAQITAPAPASAAQTTAVPLREVSTPVSAATWSQDVGNQIGWMVNQRESRAELVLNPPALGRIEVSITLNGDQASASFVSANPEVRDALQGSLPRLREVLADAGVFLGQADIGSRSSSQGGSDTEKGRNSPGDSFASAAKTLLGSSDDFMQAGSSSTIARGRGLIDLFA